MSTSSTTRQSNSKTHPNGVTTIPPGYKQTEIGVIPENWVTGRLEEFFSFISYGFTNPMPSVEHGVFMITAADIADGRIQYDTARHTTDIAYRTLLTPKSKPQKNDVLITKDGSLGRLALVGDEVVCINQSVAIIRPNNRIVPIFMKLLLESHDYQRKMVEDAGGSTIKHIYITKVNLMLIGVPSSLPEQQAIARALSDVDELIEALDTLIAKKRAIKQATMQQLLTGKTRLPGFSGEWEMKRLGEITSFYKGSGLSKADLSLNGKNRCIHYGELFTTYGERIAEVLNGTDREGTFFRSVRNDVLMPTSDVTPNGLATASCTLLSDIILGGDILVIRAPENLLNGEFLAHAIKMLRNQIMQLVSGTTVFHLYGSDMANFTFSAPNVDEQTAIATVLSDMDAEIATQESRLDKTKQIKQGMMQQLLTGRIRLVIPPKTEALP